MAGTFLFGIEERAKRGGFFVFCEKETGYMLKCSISTTVSASLREHADTRKDDDAKVPHNSMIHLFFL